MMYITNTISLAVQKVMYRCWMSDSDQQSGSCTDNPVWFLVTQSLGHAPVAD